MGGCLNGKKFQMNQHQWNICLVQLQSQLTNQIKKTDKQILQMKNKYATDRSDGKMLPFGKLIVKKRQMENLKSDLNLFKTNLRTHLQHKNITKDVINIYLGSHTFYNFLGYQKIRMGLESNFEGITKQKQKGNQFFKVYSDDQFRKEGIARLSL